MELLITGATGLTGNFFIERLTQNYPDLSANCLVRPTSDYSYLKNLNPNLQYLTGDSSTKETWQAILSKHYPKTIIHIASIRHIPIILESLETAKKTPRLIVVGTTGVYSQFNQYSAIYREIESQLAGYPGSHCLVRPTMIYGSHRDKNLHKLIKFCHRYGFFPVFGSGNNLVQPIHADDIAKTLLYAWQNPNIQGAYDISGESIVNFRELLALVEKLIDKPARPLFLPLNFGILSATILEKILKKRSPIRKEQILRLQEDKAYPHDAAKRDLQFSPRSLEVGLKEEVELMRSQGII